MLDLFESDTTSELGLQLWSSSEQNQAEVRDKKIEKKAADGVWSVFGRGSPSYFN